LINVKIALSLVNAETRLVSELQTKLAAEFRHQGKACVEMGSALYADLCERVAVDVETGGLCWSVLESHAHLRFGLALPLRFLGGVHRLVHLGRAPELTAQYPSVGGVPNDDLWPAFLRVVDRERAEVVAALDRDVQTNEVGRSAALSEGFRVIQTRTQRPLELREIGTSGGLNLGLDMFAYVDAERFGGDSSSPLRIVDRWRGAVGPSLVDLNIVDRAGCDPNPIDPTSPDGRATLLGFLWPDQTERIERTAAAIAIASKTRARIEKANADEWLTSELEHRTPGLATVVFHSIVWQYIDKAERQRITEIVEAAGSGSTAANPLAWLRFEPHEPDRECAAMTLRLWDGAANTGAVDELALAGFHGQWVEMRSTVFKSG
jgi:hypothetical protein